MTPKWSAVAINHWVATINGHPVSILKVCNYWTLARRYSRTPCLQFQSLKSAAQFAIKEPV